MRIYLSGPITDVENYEESFEKMTSELRAKGYDVISPVELDGKERSKTWGQYLGRDLEILKDEDLDAIVLLPGWENSEGCHLEVAAAKWRGLEILEVKDYHLEPVEQGGPLERAVPLVHGNRQAAYGHPSEDFNRTAAIWRAMFGWDVKVEDVPLAMIAIKLSRLRKTPFHEDSLTDICGYAETYEMCKPKGTDAIPDPTQ